MVITDSFHSDIEGKNYKFGTPNKLNKTSKPLILFYFVQDYKRTWDEANPLNYDDPQLKNDAIVTKIESEGDVLNISLFDYESLDETELRFEVGKETSISKVVDENDHSKEYKFIPTKIVVADSLEKGSKVYDELIETVWTNYYIKNSKEGEKIPKVAENVETEFDFIHCSNCLFSKTGLNRCEVCNTEFVCRSQHGEDCNCYLFTAEGHSHNKSSYKKCAECSDSVFELEEEICFECSSFGAESFEAEDWVKSTASERISGYPSFLRKKQFHFEKEFTMPPYPNTLKIDVDGYFTGISYEDADESYFNTPEFIDERKEFLERYTDSKLQETLEKYTMSNVKTFYEEIADDEFFGEREEEEEEDISDWGLTDEEIAEYKQEMAEEKAQEMADLEEEIKRHIKYCDDYFKKQMNDYMSDWSNSWMGEYNIDRMTIIHPTFLPTHIKFVDETRGITLYEYNDKGKSIESYDAETFESDPEEGKQSGFNHHGDLPFKEMDKIYKDNRKQRKYNMNHPKDGSKVPLSRRKDWELIESDTVDDGGDLLIVEALYEDKSSRNKFYILTFYFDLTNHTSPYKINPNDENSYRWDFYKNFNFDPVNPRGYASLIISDGNEEGRIISSHRFKEMNAESFEANAKTGNKVFIITRRCEDYSAYRELDVAGFGSLTEARKKFNLLFKEQKKYICADETIADAKDSMSWGEYWGIMSFNNGEMIYELREVIVGNKGDFYFDAEGEINE